MLTNALKESPQIPRSRSQLQALDGVRGLAIVVVMAHHFRTFLPPSAIFDPLKLLLDYGWVGVDLFFVLSGFLITGILIQSRTAENYFSSFYMRRILRIFPLYYLCLVGMFTLVSVIPIPIAAIPFPEDRKLYFLFLTNWLSLWHGNWGPNMLGHFWSLAVEEQFYLFWPVVLWLVPIQRILKLTLALSLLALLIRVYWISQTGISVAIALATVTRMDSLLAGATAAVLARDRNFRASIRSLGWWAAAPLAAFVAGVLYAADVSGATRFYQSIGYTLLAIGFSALVLRAALSDGSPILMQRVLCNPWLRQFGKYSFGLYVYHVPILGACDIIIYRQLPETLTSIPLFGVVYVTFLAIVSFLVAKFSYENFERKILNLKTHFESRYPSGLGPRNAATDN